MHNGVFTSLKEVVDFYNTRDTDVKWAKPEIATTMNTEELGNLGLSDQEVDDIVAFMRTLSDGYELGEHAAIEPEDAIKLPYVRVEGQDVASKIYSVRMESTTLDKGSLQYHVTQIEVFSLTDNYYPTFLSIRDFTSSKMAAYILITKIRRVVSATVFIVNFV